MKEISSITHLQIKEEASKLTYDKIDCPTSISRGLALAGNLTLVEESASENERVVSSTIDFGVLSVHDIAHT